MLLLLALLACSGSPARTAGSPTPQGAHSAEVAPSLEAHSELFEKDVLTPVPGVHVAIGYALSNVIALEGPSGLVIVDTTESRTAAEEALAALRERTDKPIAAVVLTHNHADHVFGSGVFAPSSDVPVWAHADTEAGIDRVVNVVRDTIAVRSARMFGTALPPERVPNAGIGPQLRFAPDDIALARPTHTFEDRATLEAGGLRLELVHAPGETDDQIYVWWPERRVLLPADNIYEAFPNLYTIRGTPHRDLRKWVSSLDAMRDLRAEVLVPQHTRPLQGASDVEATLTAYRDAIQYVHDQTVRGMNQGATPDELAASLTLPPHLATHPWLLEHYGRVPWSVRSVHAGYMGWFDGDASTLEPLPPDERARHYLDAFSTGVPLPQQARDALEAGDARWAAELARLWQQAEPMSPDASALLAASYEALAAGHTNPCAHHWYATEARELRGELTLTGPDPATIDTAFLDTLPIDAFMSAMGTRLKAEETLDADLAVRFVFEDIHRTWVVHVRRGVAEIRERDGSAAVTVRTTARAWRRLVARNELVGALRDGDLSVEGDPVALVRFLSWFER